MAVIRYTYKQIDDWLLSQLESWEEKAEHSAVALGAVANDPYGARREALTQLWEHQERIIDAIGMLRRQFREYDRKRIVDASHDIKKEGSI